MLVFDTSAVLAVVSDIDRPDLIDLIYKFDNYLTVPPSVNAEIKNPQARKIVDGFMVDGIISTINISTSDEISAFKRKYQLLGLGEIDVILTCKKMSEKGIIATGIIDERRGRSVAKEQGLDVTGLLGLLARLRQQKILGEPQYNDVVVALRSSKFRLPLP